MSHRFPRPLGTVGLILACACLFAPASVVMADSAQRYTLQAETLVVRNLIGQIEITGHSGAGFEIEVRTGGRDATPDRLTVETREGRTASLVVVFPVDESRRYVYPRLGGGRSQIRMDGSAGWIGRLLGRDEIEVSGSGRGLELWADLSIRVPSGAALEVEHGVGDIFASEVTAELRLDSRSGAIEASGIRGEVTADTGSGKVELSDIEGDVLADTGSGHVVVSDCRGDKINIDTGSGRVELDRVDARRLLVDTGSGKVEATGVSADDVKIDTGSGSVLLELDRMGPGEFEIDTGSGTITLVVPPGVGADVEADTGSGGIRVDLGGEHRIIHEDEDEAELVIGGGGTRVSLSTGSGGIRIRDR